MQGLILAAGMGQRLKEYCREKPKAMLEINGEKLIGRQIKSLNAVGIYKIIIACGYKKEKIEEYVTENFKENEIIFVNNNEYKTTNNIYSLFLAREYLTQDNTILIESDLIFDNCLIEQIVKNENKNIMAVAKYKSWMNGTVVTINNDGIVTGLYGKKEFDIKNIEKYYKTINIYKLNKDFCKKEYIPTMEEYIKKEQKNIFYEDVFNKLIVNKKIQIYAQKFDNVDWYEIDNKQDLDIAKCIFSKKIEEYQKRYGGYWRFPNLKDFCYLENPKFPPKDMIEKINSFSNELINKYPSSIDIQNMNAANYFNIDKDKIIVGNGSAELIKELGDLLVGTITVNIPVFNEYVRCFKRCKINKNNMSKDNYFYNKETIIKSMDKTDVIAIVNPDNPSGNFIKYEDIIEILEYAKSKSIKVIIDESFIDFADNDKKYTLIDNKILDEYKNLIVIKSISKSYGVPGIRVGILATSDKEIIEKIKNNLGVWNINSFAEYFLQILPQYQKEYEQACNYIIDKRIEMYKELKKIDFLEVYESQANYFMCKLLNCDSKYLSDYLLDKHRIFIKDLKNKEGFENKNYIRISVKTKEDNEQLIKALKEFNKNRKGMIEYE